MHFKLGNASHFFPKKSNKSNNFYHSLQKVKPKF